MRFLSGRDLDDLLPPHALIEAIEQGLRDFAEERITVPARLHTHRGDMTLLTMPILGREVFGVKVVSVMPANAARGLPVIHGLMTLYDGDTGQPLAVLNAAALTAQRTGAVSAIGMKYTTPEEVDSIGVIGIGVQGTWAAILACAVRPLRTIYFVSRSEDKAQRFIDFVSRKLPSVCITRCKDVDELLSRTHVVFTATTSSTPVMPDDLHQLEGKHFIGIGAYKSNMQEIPDSAYALAQEVVVDSHAAREEVGDLIGPLASGVIQSEDVVHLAELVTGRRSIDTARTTVFKSIGLALYDLYAAQAFCAEAQRLGRGTNLDI